MDRTIEEIQKGLNVMKFDVVVGNPPYQEAGVKDGSRDEPVYHEFIKLAYEISDKSVLITPGRFLFNAGQTPKSWNEKMLADEHLKVVHYEQDSSKIFPNTDIKGGIAVTYHDKNKIFGAIDTFTPFEELNSILLKVESFDGISLTSIVFGTSNYQYTEKVLEDFPELRGQITKSQIKTNAFDKLTQIFFDKKPENGENYIQLIGRQNNERTYKWIKRDYVTDGTNL
ncbi:TPA: Eco57I restriction-modification methylase domain-containing protein, partial [Clostridioides difficile]